MTAACNAVFRLTISCCVPRTIDGFGPPNFWGREGTKFYKSGSPLNTWQSLNRCCLLSYAFLQCGPRIQMYLRRLCLTMTGDGFMLRSAMVVIAISTSLRLVNIVRRTCQLVFSSRKLVACCSMIATDLDSVCQQQQWLQHAIFFSILSRVIVTEFLLLIIITLKHYNAIFLTRCL